MSETGERAAIVTGGGTGIGEAITRCFVGSGWKVIILGRREEPLKVLSEALGKAVSYISGDITKADDRRAVINAAIERYSRLDTLINSAAIAPLGKFVDTTDEQFENTYVTNLVSPAALIRKATPHLEKTSGSVVKISAVAARGVLPSLTAYLTTKAALNHLTRLLAVELGPLGIRVNAVAPGPTKTAMVDELLEIYGEENIAAMTPLGRLGVPSDIAKTVCFLAGPKSAWVTGQVVDTVGGMLL